jgi:O-antigen/teichoic acid export membrane protein
MIEHRHVIVSKRLVAINSASSVFAKLVAVVAVFWAYHYLLGRIPPEEFAVLPVIMSLMVLAPLFFTFLTGGIGRYIVAAYAKGDFEQVKQIVSSIVPMLVGAAAIFLIVSFVCILNIERILNIAPQMVGETRLMLGLLCVNVVAQMIFVPFTTGYQVRQQFVELNVINILHDMLRITLLLVFLLGVGPRVVWVVVATVIADVAGLAVTVVRSRQMIRELRFESRLFDLRKAWELMSFGMWTALASLGATFDANAATLLLNQFGTAVDVTSYYVSLALYRNIDLTSLLARKPLGPVMVAMYSVGDTARLRSTVMRGGRYSLWAVLAVAFPLAAYREEFVQLYFGTGYTAAPLVILLLMLVLPFNQATALLGMTIMAMGRIRLFYVSVVLFQVTGFALMIFLVVYAKMGAIGVAMGNAITAILSHVFFYWPLCWRYIGSSGDRFIREVFVRGCSPAIAGYAVCLGLRTIDAPQSWWTLGLYSAVGGLVYLAVLFAFCLTEKDQRDVQFVLRRMTSLLPGHRSTIAI